MASDGFKTLVLVLNGLFCVLAIALVTLGVGASRAAHERPSRRSRWIALSCGLLLSAASVAAFTMALTLNGEREPLWLVTLWLFAAVGFLIVAVRDFSAFRPTTEANVTSSRSSRMR